MDFFPDNCSVFEDIWFVKLFFVVNILFILGVNLSIFGGIIRVFDVSLLVRSH